VWTRDGLVRQRARARALLDPRAAEPNDNGPGPNVPPVSVGPTSSTNADGNFVLGAQAWSGWPTTDVAPWQTPPLEDMSDGGQFSGYGFGRQSPGGYLRRVSTVMTCADLNSRQLASFPAYAVKGREPLDLPSWYVNGPEPSLYPDWSAFMKAASNSYWVAGETILWCVERYRSNGYPSRFVVLNPARVTNDEDGEWWLNDDVHLNRADVCHVPYQLIPGKRRGVGPLMWAASAVVDAATLDQYAANIARLGVWGVLKVPGEMTKKQADDMKWGWAESRASSVGLPAVVSGGVEYDTVTMSPRDLALLDLKWFDHQMIAAAMGVPAVLANLPQSAGLTYSSTLMLMDFHWRATLRPAAQSFSGALSKWALPMGTFLEFNPDRYVQPDLEARARAYQTLFGIVDEQGRRAMTVDEIRLAERFPTAARTGNVSATAGPLVGPATGEDAA
jgi:HK97 family phage portal protein